MTTRDSLPASTQTRLRAADFFALYPHETNLSIQLLNGEVIVSSPTVTHQRVSMSLSLEIGSVIRARGLGELQAAPSDVIFDDDNVVQPDLFFVAKEGSSCFINTQNKWQGAPDLCIEILSPTSHKHDRQTKFALYEQHGVKEYWIVDPAYASVEVFVYAPDGYQRQGLFSGADEIHSSVIPQLKLLAQDLFTG